MLAPAHSGYYAQRQPQAARSDAVVPNARPSSVSMRNAT
jgi:hypothetical protein